MHDEVRAKNASLNLLVAIDGGYVDGQLAGHHVDAVATLLPRPRAEWFTGVVGALGRLR